MGGTYLLYSEFSAKKKVTVLVVSRRGRVR